MATRANQKQQIRERAAAARAEQQARDRKRRMLQIGVGVLVLVLLVGGGIGWQTTQSQVEVTDAGPQVASERLDDGIALGSADAPVLDVYLDFLCPHCAEMEERIGSTIAELAEDGDARVVLHPLTFIDETESARSAAALACAAGTSSVLGYQAALFENAGGGFSADRLVEIGQGVGLTDTDFEQCVRDESELAWTEAVSAEGSERGVRATPTIFLDGEELDIAVTESPEAFRTAVLGS